MTPNAKRPGWIALGSALVFNLLLLALQSNNPAAPGFMRKWLLDALVPTEKAVDSSARGIRGIWEGYIWLIGVREENEKLTDENNRLRMHLHQLDEEIREARRLREFLGVAESGIGKMIAARVIGRDPTRSSQTLTIDRGQGSGVRLNASVITPAGVVGRIIGVGSGSAVVQLITDSQSRIAAALQESRVQALFRGTGGSELELEYINDDSVVAVGAVWITSGLDQIHPKGLPLATVTFVGPGELFRSVLAKPTVDLTRLEEVLVVTEPARPGEEVPHGPATTLPSD
jgi:rod shape-determining protein MreC